MGLDRCVTALCGAAPVSQEVVKFFMSLDINLLDCYGMSESSGILTLNTSGSHSLGSVGQGLPGIKMKIVDPNERGEKL